MAHADTKVLTPHVPLLLAEKVEKLAIRLARAALMELKWTSKRFPFWRGCLSSSLW